MELYFGTQYVKVTAKGLNESAENAADDSSILTQKMKDLLNVDPEILTHVLDSSASLDTSVMNIINNNNVTDSPKDDAEEASEIGGLEGGQTGGQEEAEYINRKDTLEDGQEVLDKNEEENKKGSTKVLPPEVSRVSDAIDIGE